VGEGDWLVLWERGTGYYCGRGGLVSIVGEGDWLVLWERGDWLVLWERGTGSGSENFEP